MGISNRRIVMHIYTSTPIHSQRVGVIIQGNVPLFDSLTERNPL